MSVIHQIQNKLYDAVVIKRPSASCKTPYVADIYIPELDLTTMAHSPALGCGGLADAGSTIFMIPANEKSKCDYTLYLSEVSDEDMVRLDTFAVVLCEVGSKARTSTTSSPKKSIRTGSRPFTG